MMLMLFPLLTMMHSNLMTLLIWLGTNVAAAGAARILSKDARDPP